MAIKASETMKAMMLAAWAATVLAIIPLMAIMVFAVTKAMKKVV